jgi:hypothetical protein
MVKITLPRSTNPRQEKTSKTLFNDQRLLYLFAAMRIDQLIRNQFACSALNTTTRFLSYLTSFPSTCNLIINGKCVDNLQTGHWAILMYHTEKVTKFSGNLLKPERFQVNLYRSMTFFGEVYYFIG